LPDHRLAEYLDLYPNLDCGDGAPKHAVSRNPKRNGSWNKLSESTVTPSSINAPPLVLDVLHPLGIFDSLPKLLGSIKGIDVFRQINGDRIAPTGIAMKILSATK